MVRAPCCEKMGMKKGPWTPEEDEVLVDYIQQYGHGNWRALPKHAGLLRCGKSCRLRWTNYLRPDIKRGNFSREEEESVIELHGMLGNRWSAIAAKLPGRTDNEIKNVWHTHLKKRAALRKNQLDLPEFSDPDQSSSAAIIIDVSEFENKEQHQPAAVSEAHHTLIRSESTTTTTCHHVPPPVSPQQSCSDISSSLISTSCDNNNYYYPTTNYYNNMFMDDKVDSPGYFPETDESFWSDVLSSTSSAGNGNGNGNNYTAAAAGDDFPAFEADLQPYDQYYPPLSPLLAMEPVHAACSSSNSSSSSLNNMHDDMDFWYNLFKRAGEYSSDLPGI